MMHSARTRLTTDGRQLPYFPYWLSISLITLVASSLAVPMTVGGKLPDATLLLTGITSALCLSLISLRPRGVQGFMRIGFHAGVAAFFLLMPLLFPAESTARISTETREKIGVILIVSVVGFEVGYWLTHLTRIDPPCRGFEIEKTRGGTTLLVRLTLIGAVVWAAFEMAFATAHGVNITDVLLAMRSPIEGLSEEVNVVWRYALQIGMAMLFLAGTAACAIVVDLRGSRPVRIVCWAIIGCLAVVAFLTGSRGLFLFGLVPAAVASWSTVLRLPRIPGLRPFVIAAAAIGVIGTWFVMSAVRDVGRVEDRLQQPVIPLLQGAFDIYSQMAVVVDAFPRMIDYQYGASAIPVILGWVPRAVWPQKPYPFGLLLNHLEGEDLDRRSASLAPGLPAEGYGNFGITGVLLWVLAMGVFCRAGDDYLRKVDFTNPLGLQLAGMWCIWAALIVRGGVAEMFYTGLEITLAPLALTVFVSKRSHYSRHRVDLQIPRRRLA